MLLVRDLVTTVRAIGVNTKYHLTIITSIGRERRTEDTFGYTVLASAQGHAGLASRVFDHMLQLVNRR
jgi:hypothetical protein